MERKKKPASEIIKYSRNELMSFAQVSGSEGCVGPGERGVRRSVLLPVARSTGWSRRAQQQGLT